MIGLVRKFGIPLFIFIAFGVALMSTLTVESAVYGILDIQFYTDINDSNISGTYTIEVYSNINFTQSTPACLNVTFDYWIGTDFVDISTNTTGRNSSAIGDKSGSFANWTYAWDTSSLDINDTILRVSIINESGSTATNASQNITIDNTAPAFRAWVANTTSNGTANLTFGELNVNFTFTEDNPLRCIIEVYNNTESPNPGNYTGTIINNTCNLTILNLADTGWVFADNTSWKLNWSGYINDTAGSVFRTGIYEAQIDSTAPVINNNEQVGLANWSAYNISNTTYISIIANVTDNHTDTVKVYIFMNDNSSISYILNRISILNVTNNYTMNITNISQDGTFILQIWANDTFGNSAWSSVNYSGMVNYLPAKQWSLVTFTGPLSDESVGVMNFTQRLPGVTSVSVFDNAFYYKKFTTFTITAINTNNYTAIIRNNATWVYSTQNIYWFRNSSFNTTKLNFSLEVGQLNSSGIANKTHFNLIGVQFPRTMNFTMHMIDYKKTGVAGDETLANISYVSWYNNSASVFVTCFYNFTYCGGSDANASEIVPPISDPIWIFMKDLNTSLAYSLSTQ